MTSEFHIDYGHAVPGRLQRMFFVLVLALVLGGCDRKSTTTQATMPGVSEETKLEDKGNADSLPKRENLSTDASPWPADGEVGFVAEYPHHTEVEPTGGHRSHCVAWSPDQRLLASGGADGTIVVRDIIKDEIIKQWRPTDDRIRTLAFSPGNKYLLSDDNSTGVRIWSSVDFEELGTKDNAAHAVFLEDEKVLATIRNTGVIGSWSPATTGQPQTLADAGKSVFSLDVDANQELVATASWRGTVQVRNLSGGDLVREWQIDAREVAISKHATNVLVGVGEDSSVRLLSTDLDEEIWKRSGIVCCDADFIDDARMVLTGGWSEKTPCVAWDVERGRAIHNFSRAKAVGDLAVSPDGRFMATASTDGYVRVFRLPNADQIAASLEAVDAEARKALAHAKRNSQTYDEWMSRLQRAIDLDPGLAEAYYLRAQVKEGRGKGQNNLKLLEEAAQDYLTAIRWDGKISRWHFQCAALHSNLGQLETADQHYRRAIELIRGPEHAKPEGPDDLKFLAFSYLNNCDVLIRMNKEEDAIEFGDAAVEFGEGIPMAHLNRGRAYGANRLFDQALKSLHKALELAGPNFSNAHLGLANAHFDLAELDAAYRHQMTAMMLTGADPGRLQMLATIELLRGRYESSIGQVAPLTTMPNASASSTLAAGEAWAAAGDFDEAEKQFRKALATDASLARAYVFLSELQAQRGQFELEKQSLDAALSLLNESVVNEPDDAFRRNIRGSFFMRTGQIAKARQDFAAATSLKDRFFWSLANLSLTYSASSNPTDRDGKKALELADQACEITLHRNAWCLSVRAAALAELGRFDEAAEAQRDAVGRCASREVHKYRERLRMYEGSKPFRFAAKGDQESWLSLERVIVPHDEAPVGTFDCFRKNGPPAPLPKPEVAKQQDAVVLIKSESGFGTGMIVDKRGYVLTCAHVLPYAGPVSVTFGAAGTPPPGKFQAEAEVVAADHRNDLALLRFTPPTGVELATVRLGIGGQVDAAEEILVIGNPGVGEFVLEKPVFPGSVANARQPIGQFVKRRHVQITADVAPGCSGGPVFNLKGDVIGVVDQKAVIPRTGFAIPMDVVAEFLGVPADQK